MGTPPLFNEAHVFSIGTGQVGAVCPTKPARRYATGVHWSPQVYFAFFFLRIVERPVLHRDVSNQEKPHKALVMAKEARHGRSNRWR